MNQYLIDVPDEKVEEVSSVLETLNVKMDFMGKRNVDPVAALAALQRIADRKKAELENAMNNLVEMGGISEIEDASAWQREIRQDRPLPGRE